jgi:hypothetical protein
MALASRLMPESPDSAQLRRTDVDPQCPLYVDIVEKLEFLRRSQFRGPPEASTENSLGVRLSDRSCHVRRSNRRCCGNYRCRQHYVRSSEIFAAPQFPSFSTVSVDSGRPVSVDSSHPARGPLTSPRCQTSAAFADRSLHRTSGTRVSIAKKSVQAASASRTDKRRPVKRRGTGIRRHCALRVSARREWRARPARGEQESIREVTRLRGRKAAKGHRRGVQAMGHRISHGGVASF